MRGVGRSVASAWGLASRGRYEIGPGLLANHTLRLGGPGRIVLGTDVNAWARSGANVLRTFEPEAVIEIGDRVRLNGAGLQAATRISVGDDSILASCTLVDTDHHGVNPESRHLHEGVRSAPITIGRNVWIVGGTMVLKGVSIGDDSIIGFGSVVTTDIPSGVLAAGRPARVVRRLREDAAIPLEVWRLRLTIAGASGPEIESVADRLGSRPLELGRITADTERAGVGFDVSAADRLDAVRCGMRCVEEALLDLGVAATISGIDIEGPEASPAPGGTPARVAASHR